MAAYSFVLPLKDLESERIRLMLFEPEKHIPLLFAAHQATPDLWHYCFFPTEDTQSEAALLEWHNKYVASVPTHCLWSIFDAASGSFAGITGLVNTSLENLSTEIAFVTILPAFQRTHIQTHATGLLLRFLFDELKFRRVQWTAHSENRPSITAALRLGFVFEGIMRWHRVLPQGKDGAAVNRANLGKEESPGRHTAMLAVCWDDWEKEGVKARLQALLDRAD